MSPLGTRLDELRVALMLLTRLPAGQLTDPVPSLAQARWGFALVGLLIGAMCWMGHALLMAVGTPPAIAALLTLALMTMITGALHLDGLADLADGLGGGRDKAHCLEIMRDSRIGAYGVVALVLGLGLWSAALTTLAEHASVWMFLATGCLSRFAMTVLLEWLPPARSDGLGQMAIGRQPLAVLIGAGVSLLCLVPLGFSGVAVALAVAGMAGFVAYKAMRRIGGQTGDVLGATQFLCETAGWTILAIMVGAF